LIGCAAARLPGVEQDVMVDHVFLKNLPFGKQKTEVFLFRPPGRGPFPGIVLLHGDQPEPTERPGGKEFFYDGTGEFLASQGYAVLAPSMPGFGHTSGKRDFVGPQTLARLGSAINHFQDFSYVDSTRIVLFGASRGATAAALLARSLPEVRGLILQSGLYDLRGIPNGTGRSGGKSPESYYARRTLREQVLKEAGNSREGLARRSPAAFSKELSSPILLIHGTEDQFVSVDQMRRFAGRLRKEMGDRREVVSREVRSGHVVSGAVVWSEALPFLERCLRNPSLASRRNRETAK
jgi:dipeptidyl aminopeptidase/acylaminoacyl peptidase